MLQSKLYIVDSDRGRSDRYRLSYPLHSISLARMIATRTLPEALRVMANQLEDVSELLFGSFNRDIPVNSCIRSSANNPAPVVYSFDN